MIAAARHKQAGAIIATGVLLFMFAVGVNTLYSLQAVCLDVLPPQCFTGYDGLSENQRIFLSPGLYIIGALVTAAGAALWFARDRVLETSSV